MTPVSWQSVLVVIAMLLQYSACELDDVAVLPADATSRCNESSHARRPMKRVHTNRLVHAHTQSIFSSAKALVDIWTN